MKSKSIIFIVYLLVVSVFTIQGQDSPLIRLITIDGKNIDNNIYTSFKFKEGILDGKKVFLTDAGKIELVSPYKDLVREKISIDSDIYHYYRSVNGKWAVFNSQSQQVTDFEYDDIRSIHDNVIAVKKGEFWGAVDTLGTQLLSFDYDYIEEFKGSFVTLRNKRANSFCLINKHGKILIEKGVNGTKLVRKDNPNLIAVEIEKYGIMDINGKIILPFEYSNMETPVEPDNAFSMIQKPLQYGAVDKKGKLIIDTKYDKIDIFPQGAIVTDEDNNLYSFFNAKGELKLTSKNKILNLKNNRLEIQDDPCSTLYYNYQGELIETLFNGGYNISNPGPYYDCKLGLYGYSDGQKLIIPCMYERIKRLDGSHFEVRKKDKDGIIDINNKVLLPIKYKYLTNIAQNRSIASTFDEKDILFDWNGKQLTPNKYTELRRSEFDSTLLISHNYNEEIWGIRNIDGKQVVPDIYRNFKPFEGNYLGNGYYLVLKNSLYRIFNGKTLTEEVVFQPYTYFRINKKIVGFRSEGKQGAYVSTPEGLKKIPAEYDEIKILKNGSITAKKEGKWGLIDSDNNIKIPFEYKYIYDYYNDIVRVSK